MTEISRKEFAEAAVAAITTVRHLYSELAKLYGSLRDALATDPDPLRQLVGATRLTRGVKSDTVPVRDVFTALFRQLEEGESGEPDDADLEDETEADDEEGAISEKKKKKAPLEIDATDALLAVKIVLRDTRQGEGFEPQIQYAILTDWAVGDKHVKPKEDSVIQTRWYAGRKLPLVLDPALSDAARKRVVTRASAIGRGKHASKTRLSCAVATPVAHRPLYDLDSPDAVEALANDMKALLQQVIGADTAEIPADPAE